MHAVSWERQSRGDKPGVAAGLGRADEGRPQRGLELSCILEWWLHDTLHLSKPRELYTK